MSVIKVNEKNFEAEVMHASGKVIVDFYADWCGPCKLLAPILEEIASEYSDVKIVKVDVDNNPSIASKYGVMSIPTVYLFKDGIETTHFVGLRSKTEIINLINE